MYASSGKIGGWTIADTSLTASGVSLNNSGILEFTPSANSNPRIQFRSALTNTIC
jgi:hypothetical protein